MKTVITSGLIAVGFIIQTAAQPCETFNFVSKVKQSGPTLRPSVFGMTTADFNRDGITDVAYAGLDSFTVAYGNRNPSLSNSSTFAATDALTVATADFDRNGTEDIAVLTLTNNTSSTVRIYGNTGLGQFVLVRSFAVGVSIFISTGDFNNDGKADLVTSGQLRLGNGTSTMTFSTPVAFSVSGSPIRNAVADLNKDGKLDLAMTLISGTIGVFLGNGDGTFASQLSVSAEDSALGIKISDINRDGNPDIITGNRAGRSISILVGNGTGNFTFLANLSVGSTADRISTADFNGDGNVDIVTSGEGNTPIRIFAGNGNGGFASPVVLTQFVKGDVITGDFTGDGMTDIFAINVSGITGIGETILLENGCGGYTRNPSGDFDGDGFTDIAVFRPSQGLWIILKSSDSSVIFKQFGVDGDIPIDGDFDGDGKNDYAIYRPSNGLWFVENSSDGSNFARQFGTSTDKPVTDDYDKDGKADIAFFRPSSGEWFVLRSSENFNSFFSFPFGANGDIPIVKKGA